MNKLRNIMLIMLSCLLLVACGSSEYKNAIDDVIKLENKSLKNGNDSKDSYVDNLEKNKSNIYVYEDGSVIVLEYKYHKKEDYKGKFFILKI